MTRRPIQSLVCARGPFAGTVALVLLLTACEEPRPRSFADFMDDRIAREGTISFCNEAPLESATNIECANALRAAAAIALRAEHARREELERESARKLEAMRLEMAERERIVRETMLAAARAERDAYEQRWAPPPRPDEEAEPLDADPEPSVDPLPALPAAGQAEAQSGNGKVLVPDSGFEF